MKQRLVVTYTMPLPDDMLESTRMQVSILEETTALDTKLRKDKKVQGLIFEQKVVRVGKEDGEPKRARKPRKPKTGKAEEAPDDPEPENQPEEQEEETQTSGSTPPWAK